MSGKNAGLPLCDWKGQTMRSTVSTVMSYHAMSRTGNLQLRHHTPAAMMSCRGLSQRISRLGDVASCEDTNTRNVITQPVSPISPNHSM